MTESNLLGLVSVLFFLLMGVLTWIANKAYNKLNDISVAMSALSSALHDRITGLDHRVTVIETMCKVRRSSDGCGGP